MRRTPPPAPECFECGSPSEFEHHVVPLSRGGTKTVPLCASCHGKAHDRLMSSSQLTRDALKAKKLRNERTGSIPFGSDLAPDGRTLVDNPAERRALDAIWSWHREGRSLREIAALLDEQAVPTKHGAPWSYSVVRYLIDRQRRAVSRVG